ncbi:Gmad2 immunoglobulin-like domain-containing protein [Nocardia brasiliensis]|uniref:Gmad2 immunoglobulin-like domain-containing protein n=1 Tax=Nocardia brasiliensis TaxID=37326 RepID=UPI002455B107|nr:Gmad2 immunoglobulin-like domain-containing protein [Nocardia brasiliensis]
MTSIAGSARTLRSGPILSTGFAHSHRGPIQISGTAGGACEAQFSYRITEGHDEAAGCFMAGDGTGGHGQFQTVADVSGAGFMFERLFVEVFHMSPKDGAELGKVVVPVLLGPKIVPGYSVYLEHLTTDPATVDRLPGMA